MTGNAKSRRSRPIGQLAAAFMLFVTISGTALAAAPVVVAPVLVWRPVTVPDGPQRHMAVSTPSPSLSVDPGPSVTKPPIPTPAATVIVQVRPTVRPSTPRGSSVSGAASRMGPGFGASYLALPQGPGRRVRICSAAACWTMVSTDAGPALFEQRAGRIADLSDWVWQHISGLPLSRGLCRVTIQYL